MEDDKIDLNDGELIGMVYESICYFWSQRRYAPSLRELQKMINHATGYKPSTRLINRWLIMLQDEGKITFQKSCARTIVPTNMQVIFMSDDDDQDETD